MKEERAEENEWTTFVRYKNKINEMRSDDEEAPIRRSLAKMKFLQESDAVAAPVDFAVIHNVPTQTVSLMLISTLLSFLLLLLLMTMIMMIIIAITVISTRNFFVNIFH